MLTREQLQVIKDSEWNLKPDGTRDYKKWASYSQLSQVPEGLWDTVLELANVYCYDAVNLEFGLSSSTSGMYSSWWIHVSLDCTVYINLAARAPKGYGGTFSAALADFALQCLDLKESLEKEKKEEVKSL